MYQRNIRQNLLAALQDTPVVFLHGARQTGKTTLVRSLGADFPGKYLTFDEIGPLSAAQNDPEGFLAGLDGPVILDEVQRAPELFLAIKAVVDRDRTPGRFLLTGSANILLLPELARTLVGRMETLTLWPLSQGEVEGRREDFVERAFAERFAAISHATKSPPDPTERLVRGGFPEALSRGKPDRRARWFESYLTLLLQRDVRDLAQVNGLAELPRLLSLLASSAASLRNFSGISRSSGIPQTTLKRYLSLLQAAFLIQELPAWSGNLGKRLVKSPKILLTDTGLLAHLLGTNADSLAEDRVLFGRVMENFVAMEIRKQISWSENRPQLYHYRSHAGEEVDLVLEDERKRIVGIETKSALTVGASDFKGLRSLADTAGANFHRGIVLYRGSETVPFAENLHAIPISEIWA